MLLAEPVDDRRDGLILDAIAENDQAAGFVGGKQQACGGHRAIEIRGGAEGGIGVIGFEIRDEFFGFGEREHAEVGRINREGGGVLRMDGLDRVFDFR